MTERKATDILDYREKQRKKDYVVNWLPYAAIVVALAIQLDMRWEIEDGGGANLQEFILPNLAIATTALVGAVSAFYGDRGAKILLIVGNLFIFGYFAWQTFDLLANF